MRISVAMATWQGERYLARQLATLLGQTRPPDELVVVDDASDDSTLDVLDAFAEKAPFKVHVLRSEVRQGSTGAFARAISAADGDVICLCDQDDLWMPQKLARVEAVFAERPETTFAFSDALLVDDGDVTQPRTMWEVRNFDRRLQDKVRAHPFAELSHRWLATGCTMAFRSDLRGVLLPFPTDLTDLYQPMIHDRWLSLVLSPLGPVAVLDEPLVGYRIHATQQIGMANVTAAQPAPWRLLNKMTIHRSRIRSVRTYQLAHLEEVRDRLLASGLAPGPAVDEVEGAIAHLRMRLENLDRGRDRFRPIACALAKGGYHRYARGWASAAIDLVRS